MALPSKKGGNSDCLLQTYECFDIEYDFGYYATSWQVRIGPIVLAGTDRPLHYSRQHLFIEQ
jgi:hypothetical protein